MKYVVPILVSLVIALASLVGYFAGRSSGIPTPSPASTAIAIASAEPSIVPSSTPSPTPSPTSQKVTGGGILNFPRYEITIPAGWTHSTESNSPDDEKITVQGGAYKISIQQGGFGGAMCLYPGDADFEGPAGRYSAFVELTTKSGDKFRRSTPESGTGFAVCYLTQYGWGAPTVYGHIGLTTPANPTAQDLVVLDAILTSFTKL